MDAVEHARALIAYATPSRTSNVEITDYLESLLQTAGAVTERVNYRDEFGVEKSCVVSRFGQGTGGFAYFAHSDVVPAEDWSFPHAGPFEPVIHEERLYGRGSCDMKGSLACMLAAVSRVDLSALRAPIYLTVTADEEVGYGGARHVSQQSQLYREMCAGGCHSVIGEPTGLDVVYAHKGVYGFVATAHGRAGHSSTRNGINANLAMIPFLVEMKRIHDQTESDPAWQNAEFDPPVVSWNIGINDHNPAVNITAPRSVCTVYYRPMPGQDGDALLAQAQQAADEHGIDLRVTVKGAPLYTPPDSPYVQQMVELVGRGPARTVAYGTDAGALEGLPNVVVCGPGDIAQAHTSDEWISLEQLAAGTDLYEKLIRHWCSAAL